MKRKRCLTGLVLAGVVLAGVSAEGRVFRRWRAEARSLDALTGLGGRTAYTAPVEVNGAEGQLSVVAFDAAYGRLRRDLARVFPDARFEGGEAMALARWREGGSRVAVMALDTGGQRLVFHVVCDGAGEDAPAWPEALPAPTGATAQFVARNGDTGSIMAIAETAAPVAAARAAYAEVLAADGWQEPLGGAAPGAPFAVFLKPRRLCAVLARTAPGGGTRMVVVTRRLGGLR